MVGRLSMSLESNALVGVLNATGEGVSTAFSPPTESSSLERDGRAHSSSAQSSSWRNASVSVQDTTAMCELVNLGPELFHSRTDAELWIEVVPARVGASFPTMCIVGLTTSDMSGSCGSGRFGVDSKSKVLSMREVVIKEWPMQVEVAQGGSSVCRLCVPVRVIYNIASIVSDVPISPTTRLFVSLRFVGCVDSSDTHSITQVRLCYRNLLLAPPMASHVEKTTTGAIIRGTRRSEEGIQQQCGDSSPPQRESTVPRDTTINMDSDIYVDDDGYEVVEVCLSPAVSPKSNSHRASQRKRGVILAPEDLYFESTAAASTVPNSFPSLSSGVSCATHTHSTSSISASACASVGPRASNSRSASRSVDIECDEGGGTSCSRSVHRSLLDITPHYSPSKDALFAAASLLGVSRADFFGGEGSHGGGGGSSGRNSEELARRARVSSKNNTVDVTPCWGSANKRGAERDSGIANEVTRGTETAHSVGLMTTTLQVDASTMVRDKARLNACNVGAASTSNNNTITTSSFVVPRLEKRTRGTHTKEDPPLHISWRQWGSKSEVKTDLGSISNRPQSAGSLFSSSGTTTSRFIPKFSLRSSSSSSRASESERHTQHSCYENSVYGSAKQQHQQHYDSHQHLKPTTSSYFSSSQASLIPNQRSPTWRHWPMTTTLAEGRSSPAAHPSRHQTTESAAVRVESHPSTPSSTPAAATSTKPLMEPHTHNSSSLSTCVDDSQPTTMPPPEAQEVKQPPQGRRKKKFAASARGSSSNAATVPHQDVKLQPQARGPVSPGYWIVPTAKLEETSVPEQPNHKISGSTLPPSPSHAAPIQHHAVEKQLFTSPKPGTEKPPVIPLQEQLLPLPAIASFVVAKHHTSRNGTGRRILTFQRPTALAAEDGGISVKGTGTPVALTISLRKLTKSDQVLRSLTGTALPAATSRGFNGSTQSSVASATGPCTLAVGGDDLLEMWTGARAYDSGAIHQTKVHSAECCVVIRCNGKLVTAVEMESTEDVFLAKTLVCADATKR